MKYDFDTLPDRRGTNSIKWEFSPDERDPFRLEHTDRFLAEGGTLPMWVADMDFPTAPAITEALIARAKHGIYGYSAPTDSYFRAVTGWMKRRHGWDITADSILTTPGVVPALNMLVRTFVAPGEKVLVQPPVYYPFFSAITNNSAEVVPNELVYERGRYRMDFEDLEEKTKDPAVRMAFLCSPHNPVGRVWRAEELARFGEICIQNDVMVVSDEIHGDLVYRGNDFVPFTRNRPEFSDHTIVCTAPSKTFNLAGLQTSNIIISNPAFRARFRKTLDSNGLFGVGTFGLVAVEVAYDHGEEWLEQVLGYIEGNLCFLEEYVQRRLKGIRVVHPEGTYLIWLDCRDLGLDRRQLRRLFLEKARIQLDDGFMFGDEGVGFARINIACPRAILADALDRIRIALDGS